MIVLKSIIAAQNFSYTCINEIFFHSCAVNSLYSYHSYYFSKNSNMASHDENNEKKVSTDGRNVAAVLCIHCDTCILNPSVAAHLVLQYNLPTITQRKDKAETETEEVCF